MAKHQKWTEIKIYVDFTEYRKANDEIDPHYFDRERSFHLASTGLEAAIPAIRAFEKMFNVWVRVEETYDTVTAPTEGELGELYKAVKKAYDDEFYERLDFDVVATILNPDCWTNETDYRSILVKYIRDNKNRIMSLSNKFPKWTERIEQAIELASK